MKFSDFNFDSALVEGLDAMGFKDPTPVQVQAIPPIMEGKDVMACAQTGTGKTAAFLLPVIDAITKNPTGGINTIIIEPTRELAMQIDRALEGFSYFTPVSSIAVYGGRDGQSMEMEKRALKKGAPIVVATPGRFTAHLDLGYVNFDNIRYLILDEADRMLDMGFAPAIMNIIHKLPRERQNLLFSATMPSDIRRFAKQFLRDPVEINIAISKPAENVIQGVYEVEDHGKIRLAEYLLSDKKRLQRVLIFASTKRKVRDLETNLKNSGLNIGAIHSDLEQKVREDRLMSFKNGSLPIVVATDVLSRGIDISGIDVVINFDVPNDAEDYVHRIGRTARADASGVALTFINSKDRGRFRRIEDLIGSSVRRLQLPEAISDAKLGASRGGRGGSRNKGRGRKSNNRNSRGNSSNRKGRSKRNNRGGERK